MASCGWNCRLDAGRLENIPGTYSQTRWELSNDPVLGLHTGRKLQIGAQVQVNGNIAVDPGYVWSNSSGWRGGALPEAELAYPVPGVGISF